MMLAHRMQIREAVVADFGSHPALFADMVETLGVVARANYAAEHVAEWIAPERREVDASRFGTGYAEVRHEAKGVVGNIVPWNFPFDLSVGPLIDMLAGGNRVIIKPSDLAPACGQLLFDMVSSTFDRDQVDVINGGLALARHFATLRWDHLMFTGSPVIGREVATAAAANLVPVTLELGGKCPVVLTEDAVEDKAVGHILGIKTIKNGQMCNGVDYVFVPRAKLSDFVDIAKQHVAASMPDYSATPDCTGIISGRHLDRLLAMRQQAVDAGVDVVQLDEHGSVDEVTRRMPLSLVVDPPDSLAVMQEEIFGPLLPVKPYDSIDEVIDYINDQERPLGLYVFTGDEAISAQILDSTSSGGACVNAAAMQGAIPSLGFGGVGNSGSGRQHGLDGFREFTNPRGVFVRGSGDVIDSYNAPYGAIQQDLVDQAVEQLSGAGLAQVPAGQP